LLRHRSRQGERRAVLVLGSGATVAALIFALSLPVYRRRPDPLIVNVGPTGDVSAFVHPAGSTTTTRPLTAVTSAGGPGSAGMAGSAGAGPAAGGQEILGFAASDYDDTATGIDRDVAGLSTLAVTGATLGSHPGTVEVRPV